MASELPNPAQGGEDMHLSAVAAANQEEAGREPRPSGRRADPAAHPSYQAAAHAHARGTQRCPGTYYSRRTTQQKTRGADLARIERGGRGS